jgi:release factor glutamine methyltransferase
MCMKTPDYVGKDRDIFLDQMLRNESRNMRFLSYDITILPQVFLPSTASELLADFICVKNGDRIVDIGTGTGVLGLIAGMQGAVGYAADINPEAVKNARQNLDKYGFSRIKTIESDLFSNIPRDSYDLITFNRPFWDDYGGKKMRNIVELGFSDTTGNLLAAFLQQSSSFLAKTGKILVSVAEWENLQQVENMFSRYNYEYVMLERRASGRDERRVYRAYELII